MIYVVLQEWSVAAAKQLVSLWVPFEKERMGLDTFLRNMQKKHYGNLSKSAPNTPERRPRFLIPEELRTTPRPLRTDIIYIDETPSEGIPSIKYFTTLNINCIFHF